MLGLRLEVTFTLARRQECYDLPMDLVQVRDDIEKLSGKRSGAARRRLMALVQDDPAAAAEVLSRVERYKRTEDLKAVDAACRSQLGIPLKLKLNSELESLLELADDLVEADKVDVAGALRSYARRLYPESARVALEWLYHLDYDLEDHQRALDETLAVLERFPTSADANQFAALVLMRHFRDFERALPFIERAVDIDPLEETCWAMLAWAHASLGHTTEALRAALEALGCVRYSMRPEEGVTLALFCLYLLGPEAERAGRLAELVAQLGRGQAVVGYGLVEVARHAAELGHPESAWLEPLALVVDDQKKPGSLKKWPAFQEAKQAAKQLPKPPRLREPEEPYEVELILPPEGHRVPRLLHEFGAWLKQRELGSLGWFDGVYAESLGDWPTPDVERLKREAFSFLSTGDGSCLVLVNTGSATPAAVGYLGSEGESRSVANSLEEFLFLFAEGQTGVYELDDEEGKRGRKALKQWLGERELQVPSAPDFDFNAWRDTGDGHAAAPSAAAASTATPSDSAGAHSKPRVPTAVFNQLGPKAQAVARVMGLRADDPQLIEYVTQTLGKKPPKSVRDDVHVTAPKLGVELLFSPKIYSDAFPPIAKTANAFVPYLALAWLNKKLGEQPLGIPWKASSVAELSEVLGAPTNAAELKPEPGEGPVTQWNFPLDAAGNTQLSVTMDEDEEGLTVVMEVAQARALEEFTDVTTALFLGYAAERGLLDEARFQPHAELLRRVAARQARGSELLAAALPHGLWDDHLRADPELRDFAYCWFHNLFKKGWITRDLIGVFGKRKGEFGHDEAKLDEDTWSAVDQATPVLDGRFARWL